MDVIFCPKIRLNCSINVSKPYYNRTVAVQYITEDYFHKHYNYLQCMLKRKYVQKLLKMSSSEAWVWEISDLVIIIIVIICTLRSQIFEKSFLISWFDLKTVIFAIKRKYLNTRYTYVVPQNSEIVCEQTPMQMAFKILSSSQGN